MAQDEGREVGIVPGRPGDRNAAGSNLGIRDNVGELITSVEDVFDLLNRHPEVSTKHSLSPDRLPESRSRQSPGRPMKIESQSLPGQIRAVLKSGPASLQDLLERTSTKRLVGLGSPISLATITRCRKLESFGTGSGTGKKEGIRSTPPTTGCHEM